VFESYDDILSVEAVCEILGIGRNNMYKLLGSGQLKAFKNGRVWKISKKALEEFVLQQSNMSQKIKG